MVYPIINRLVSCLPRFEAIAFSSYTALSLPCAAAPKPIAVEIDPTYATHAVHVTANTPPSTVKRARATHGLWVKE